MKYNSVQKKRILFLVLPFLFFFEYGSAQQSLWVGQSATCDATTAMVGLISDVTWTVNGGYVSLTGSGYYRNATATQYWSGSATVKCSWKYRLYSNDKLRSESKTWTFTCRDNPVSIYPQRLALAVGQTDHLGYSHQLSNEYVSYADAYFSCSSSCVSVDKKGNIKALSPGTAYVNVYSKISANSPYCTVTVVDLDVESVKINSTNNIKADLSYSLYATVYPENATVKSKEWFIEEGEDVISLTSAGRLTGIKPGTAKIYCIVNKEVRSNTAIVNVTEPDFLVKSTSPANNAVNISAFVSPSVTYSLALFEGNNFSSIKLRNNTTGKPVRGGASINGNTLSFKPEKALKEQTEYTLTIPAGTLKNKWGSYYNSTVDVSFKIGNWNKLTIEASLGSGFVLVGEKVSLKANNTSANIYYTLDGTTPNKKSNLYKEPIVLNGDTKLRAIAICDGYKDSEVLMRDYLISNVDMVDYYPNKEMNVYRDANPYVKFSNAIKGSIHLGEIELIKNGKGSLSGEIIVSDSIIFIIPEEPLDLGCSYQLILPYDAVKTIQGESNHASTITITTGDFATDIIMNGPELASAIKTDGSIQTWGQRFVSGNTSDGSYVIKEHDTPSDFINDEIQSVSSGYMHHALIKEDASLWMWGRQYCGEFGNNSKVGSSTPVKVMDNVLSVSCGGQSTAIIKKDHSLWLCGRNDFGQIGDSSFVNKQVPVKIMDDVLSVAAGWCVSFAIDKDGSLWAWGRNDKFQLGISDSVCVPRPIKLMDDVAIVATSATESMWAAAIKNDGSLWAWGATKPNPIKILDDVSSVAVGADYVEAVKNDGTLWAFGDNTYGQLGNGTTVSSNIPVMIMNNVSKVTSGGQTTIVNKENGSVWSWGRNYSGILGDNSEPSLTAYRSQPVQIIEGRNSSPLKGITSRKHTYYMGVGGVDVIDAVPVPLNAIYKEITWHSDNNSIVSVSNRGVIKALSVGESDIVATINDNNGATYSMVSHIVVDNTLNVKSIDINSLKVWSNDNAIYISGAEIGQHVDIHDINGLEIFNEIVNSSSLSIPIHRNGVYIIRIDSYVVRVLVR